MEEDPSPSWIFFRPQASSNDPLKGFVAPFPSPIGDGAFFLVADLELDLECGTGAVANDEDIDEDEDDDENEAGVGRMPAKHETAWIFRRGDSSKSSCSDNSTSPSKSITISS